MSISGLRFAAEFIDGEGAVHKFDDLGCMKSYLEDKGPGVRMAACFVVDYETRRWVAGPDAFYVRSQELRTPMAGGVVAFVDRDRAEKAALRLKGTLLGYHEVFK